MRHRSTPSTHRRHRRGVLAAVTLVLLALTACSVGADTAESDDSGTVAADTAGAAPTAAAVGSDGDRLTSPEAEGVGFVDADDAADASDESGNQADDAADGESGAAPPTSPATASTGERIVKEGTISIQVDPGDYDTAFGQVVARAQALGGHVSGTSSSTTPVPDGDGGEVLTSGQVTIRVPVRAFEDLITSIGEAGEITDRNITSQDVTAEYTDLESRRRNLQAQERFYLGLLEQAATVQDAVAVQQQLDGIQEQIEQITGRLNLLGDRTAFSTLTVRIAERGATPATASEAGEPGGLTPYIEDAADTLIATVGSLIVFLTFLSPFLLLAAVGYGVVRAIRRRRPPAVGSAPAPGDVPAQPQQPVGAGAGHGPAEGDGPR